MFFFPRILIGLSAMGILPMPNNTRFVTLAIIEASDSIAIQAVLPNGQPARQGVVTVKDKSTRSPEYPDEKVGAPLSLDNDGRTLLKLTGGLSDEAYLEIHLSTEAGGFHGRKLLRDIGADNLLNVELQPGMLLHGTVLLNGQPAQGAHITISKNEPINERGGFRAILLAMVESDEEGRYSAGVERALQYSVFVQNVPALQDLPLQGQFVRPNASGVAEVSPFDFQTGSEEIQGVVLDANRRPLVGVSVRVEPKIQPIGRPILLGWQSVSQLTTDQQGSFVLRNLPKGEYQIRAHWRQQGNGGALSAVAEAATGDKDVKIIIESSQASPTPRLNVQSISDY